MLTLILIPTDKDCRKTLDSFLGITTQVKTLECRQSFDIPVATKWKMFMYEGEFLSDDLKQALPEFLEKGDDYEGFSVYKSSPIGFSISPRLFKGNVKVQSDSLMPVEKNLKMTTILDGFILET